MNESNEAMRLILELDPDASLRYSATNGEWLVRARVLVVADDGEASFLAYYEPTPDAAVLTYLRRIQELGPSEVLELSDGSRKRWTGSAWVDEARGFVPVIVR